MFNKLVNGVITKRSEDRYAELYRSLLRHEAKVGGTVFGPIPAGRRREFFCLDEHTWVWHEEWRDENGQTRIQTTRYDVRPDGILKSQNGHYQKVTTAEALRFQKAAHLYVERVKHEVYAAV